MGCGRKDDQHKEKNCICEVVRAIKDIQDAAEDICDCPANCFQNHWVRSSLPEEDRPPIRGYSS